MPGSYVERFDRLEALIERGFAALASDIADTKTEITGIKTEVADLREDTHTVLADIHTELKDIRLRIDALELPGQNISGFAKEFAHLIEHVMPRSELI